MTFTEVFDSYNWDEAARNIRDATNSDVERALQKEGKRTLDDFAALISPAASHYLEPMAQLSRNLTLQRFGNTVQMYIPMYLSNECLNICTYCGFSLHNRVPRRTLTDEEILREVATIKSMGHDHILLVTGESARDVGIDYFKRVIPLIRPHFSNVSIEVQPLDQNEYEELIALGVHAVYVYQETYNKARYGLYHPRGMKSNFQYRLETADRLGRAGIHKIGLGVLLGLEDWRMDSFFCASHLKYLERNYWQTRYSISFPRLRPAEGFAAPNVEITDRDLVQLICAYRILDQEVELSISTRESQNFRNHVIHLGATALSAGSKTNPGGYNVDPQSLEQFEIADERSPNEIAEMIRSSGYEPVWKDWDRALG